MTDYAGRNFNTEFSGLVTTVAIMGGVGGACLVGYETLRQMKRLPRRKFIRFWQKDNQESGGVGAGPLDADRKSTQEDWEMGHLYHARTFHARTPSPPLSKWPLGWAWQALKLDDWFYATHCGMDNVVYVRFLRGMVWWTFLQTVTAAPILLAIDFIYSRGVSTIDMSRASISYLVTYPDPSCTDSEVTNCPKLPNEQGRRLLWIQLCALWYITFTWFYTLWWIGKGSLKIRRRLVLDLYAGRKAVLERREQERKKAAKAEALEEERFGRPLREAQGLHMSDHDDNSKGWRQRTLLVTNVPASLRGEGNVRRYFEEYLRPDGEKTETQETVPQAAQAESVTADENPEATIRRVVGDLQEQNVDKYVEGESRPEGDSCRTASPTEALMSPVQSVILVRKMGELSAMLNRRADILQQIEAAHINLAQAVLQKVSQQQRRKRNGKDAAHDDRPQHKGLMPAFLRRRRRSKDEQSSDDAAQMSGHHTPLDELASRLAKYCKEGGSRHSQSTNGLLDENNQSSSVWETLAEVPRSLLDPYQPVTRLSVLFRGQRVPTIDYLLAKLNLLTALIAEMQARPPSDYEPTSTAFVTFRDPRQARMVWRELNSQLVMKVQLAPEVKDIDWDRLMSTSFTGSLVRGFTVNAFFWAFTILWVIPLSIVSTALFSVKSLTTIFPPLKAAFASNPQLESFVSVTLPSLLVSLATMTVPEITFQISRRGQGFMTWSALYDRCLCRYWKFLVCNVLIFFCIGVTTVEAIIQQIISAPGSNQILTNVAFAFPTAAPFFVSYFILALALHSGFELVGFMVPLIVHFTGANKATTPRSRALKTLPRNFNRYYWLPFHTLIMTILFVFTILNPLVIPFGLVYVFFAMIVFKRSFAFVYYRRFMEKDGVIYFVRILRYSSDGLLIAQVVALIFFSVTNQEKAYIGLTAVLIPITVLFKVVGTQLWKSQCRAIEDDEANAICGIMPAPLTHAGEEWGHPQSSSEDVETGKRYKTQHGAPSDARASGRFPVSFAPPPTDSKIMTTWQKVHDTFHANGADKPSYIAQRAADGNPVHHPALVGANLVLRAPFAVAKKAQNDGKHIATVAKLSLGVDKALKAEAVRDNREQERKSKQDSTTVESRAQSGKQIMQDGSIVDRKASFKAGHTSMPRSRSGRSIAHDEPAPFLSGFEALSNHAPVQFDHQMLEADHNEDGEESMMSIVHQHSVRRRKTFKRSNTGVSSTPRRNQPSAYADSAPAYGEGRGNDPLTYDNEKSQHQRPATPEDVEEDNGQTSQDEDTDSEGEAPLVRPHAKIAWDDTPDNSARYNNPFYACEIHNFLWLPRDPLLPLNLCDTVEWHGVALVSSDGGDGVIGEWKEDDEEEQVAFGGLDDDAVTDVSRLGQIEGNEEIILSSHLAKHLEKHEEETVEEVSDPAAGLSKKAREDYEKALKAQRKASISEASQDAGLLSPRRLVRHSSNISANSHRSPPASVRLQLDDEFNRTQQGSGDAVVATDYVGEPALAQQQQANRTHWAPDPDNTRDHPQNQDHIPPSASMASVGSTGLRRNTTVNSDRRRRNVSGAASILSAETQSRAVTMQKALQAEVLEEERRRTIKDLVVARKQSKKGSISRVGGSRRGRGASREPEDDMPPSGPAADPVQEEDEELGEADLTRNSTILRRHQRGVDMRLRSGSVLSGTSAEPPRSPSILRAGTRSQHSTSPMPAPALEAGNGLLSISSGAGPRLEPERRPSARSVVQGGSSTGAAEDVEMSDLSRAT